MTWRTPVVLAGIAVVAAATHANIVHAGGYQASSAPLMIALAVLLSLGMGYVAYLWRDRQRLGAFLLGVCLLSGESYWVLTNAEREIAAREERDAPALRAFEARVDAEKRVANAEQALKDANAAVTNEASKKDCLKNCAAMLTDVAAAARNELAEARAALSNTPRPLSPAPLPARLGLAPWLWDLVMAGLRSLAVVGGSIAVGLGMHPRSSPTALAAPAGLPSKPPTPASTSRRKEPATKQIQRQRAAHSARNHAAEFGIKCMRPDTAAETSLAQLHQRYRTWCDENALERLSPPELAREMGALFSGAGLQVEHKSGDFVVRGVRLS